jgi:hypothetical protein
MKVKHTRKRNMEAIGMRMVLFFFAVLLSTATRAVADPDPNFYIYLCLGQSNIEGGRTIEKRDLMGDPRFQFPADFDNPSRGWKKLRRTLGYKVSETKLPVTSTGNLTVQNDPDLEPNLFRHSKSREISIMLAARDSLTISSPPRKVTS